MGGTETTAPDGAINWCYDPTIGPGPLSMPPSEERLKYFDYLFTACLLLTLPCGGLYVLVDIESDKIVAVAATNPPSPTGIHEMGSYATFNLFRKLGSPPKPGLARITAGLDGVAKKLHKKHASGRHLYVMVFAADPEVQGRGFGTTLLKFLNTVADADGVDTYLEAAGERNLGFYGTKGSFQDKGALPLEHKGQRFDWHGGVHAMVRLAPSRLSSGGIHVQPR
jgi:hypothetical protein